MFKRVTVLSILALLGATSLVLVFCLQPGPPDLLESKIRHRSSQPGPANQSRQGVQKDFWTKTPTHTRHLRLSSAGSQLQVAKQNSSFELRENMQSIEGCMDDGPEAEIRRGSAREGVFYYPANRFDANGIAFSLQSPDAPAPTSSVVADFAHWKEKTLHLSGHVHLSSKREEEIFAVADELFFQPETELLRLCSTPQSRVLVRQGDLHLSSPIVEMAHFQQGKPESIQGIGDVHLHFDREETALFEKLFGF